MTIAITKKVKFTKVFLKYISKYVTQCMRSTNVNKYNNKAIR